MERASQTYGLFAGFAAFLPLLGGFIADRWNYHTPLLLGALANVIGAFLISLSIPFLLKIALAIIALGYGIFTPSILTLLSFAYKDRSHLREAGFSFYYSSINIGVFLAMISLGWIVQVFGWNFAFLFASFVQVLGVIPIWVYLRNHHKKYRHMHPSIALSKKDPTPLQKKEKKRVFVILILTLASFFFWMPYAQGFSSMSVFILDCVDKSIHNFAVPTPWVLSSESFFLIILAPLLAVFYTFLQKYKKDPSPITKTALGLLFVSFCFLIIVVASSLFPYCKESVPLFFPILAYFFMALGEMFLAPIGLSFVSKYSPQKYTAFLVGAWYVCVGLAIYIGGSLAGLFETMQKSSFFFLFVLIPFIPSLVLLCFTKKLKKIAHLDP